MQIVMRAVTQVVTQVVTRLFTHRARAAALGTLATVALLVAVVAGAGGAAHEARRLGTRLSIAPIDALPLVLWGALVLALLWAATLTAMATAALTRPAEVYRDRSASSGSGLVGRIAGVLLAVTAFGATGGLSAASAAPATDSPVAAAPAAAAGVIPDARAAHTAHDPCAVAEEPPVPGWLPEQPARTAQVARDSAALVAGCAVPDRSGEVVVRRGDSLWSIVAARLGPQADATAVAGEWPRWYAANRAQIGDDPDLLRVGTRLHAPTALEGKTR
ncbi:LysM peptidoglycan-binding domain-containing protein [Flexivirga sp. ID2601S]|uniref:LysM peptidoglycan-binding domain-containing protein n=1 Tax=Flexivirga aerilata TaxID=1656889 RepID=A0A849AIM2_9MICO|nr:LysM domain-containing protein [Flexivirga aerilata]NNG40239.1 LysM peptidoglycan-binding domain-containing protein [Flexivirga aerilata]